VKIGPFSRGGKSRGAEAVQAADHDMGAEAVLVPLGILEASCGREQIDQLWVGFGQSRETSDFIADGLEAWWRQREALYPEVRRLHIELDNGPEINSSRTQFMKRMVYRTGIDRFPPLSGRARRPSARGTCTPMGCKWARTAGAKRGAVSSRIAAAGLNPRDHLSGGSVYRPTQPEQVNRRWRPLFNSSRTRTGPAGGLWYGLAGIAASP
jgi:hypothetical protein